MFNIKKNEGTVDRYIRVLAAVVFAFAAYSWTTGILSVILYVLAAVMLFTAITGFCALYTLLGVNTLKKK